MSKLNLNEALHWIIQSHELKVDTPSFRRAEYCIKSYSIETIRKTEKAFLKAVDRNADKKNLAYFFGILKNIQQERCGEQYHEYCREKYYYTSLLESERRQTEEGQQQSKSFFKIIVELAASAISVPECIQKNARKRCKDWLDMHLKPSGYIGSVKKKIQDAIGVSTGLDIKAKEMAWNWIEPLLSQKTEEELVTSIL